MILIIPAAFFTSWYLVNVVMWHIPLQRALRRQRVKPFDCVQCLSVWFAICLYFAPYELTRALAIIFTTGFIGAKIK